MTHNLSSKTGKKNLAASDLGTFSVFSDLPGINASEAISKLGIGVRSYMDLLSRFASNHKQDISKVRGMMSKGDWDSACRTAHTLKGLAATLGVAELSRLSLRLETVLQKLSGAQGLDEVKTAVDVESNLPQELEALLADTDVELNDIVLLIDKLPAKVEESPHQQEAGLEEVTRRLERVLAFSKGCNVSAVTELEAVLLIVTNIQIVDKLRTIQKYLEQYDFAPATDGLQVLVSSLVDHAPDKVVE